MRRPYGGQERALSKARSNKALQLTTARFLKRVASLMGPSQLNAGRTFEWQDGGGPSAGQSRGHPQGSSAVVVPLAIVETPLAETAVLETDAQNRRGTGHCGPASRGAPCRRARRAVRGARAFRTDIPLLRLLLGSKGVEVVEVISLASHGSLPCLVLVGLECARVPGARPMAPPPNDALQLTTHG